MTPGSGSPAGPRRWTASWIAQASRPSRSSDSSGSFTTEPIRLTLFTPQEMFGPLRGFAGRGTAGWGSGPDGCGPLGGRAAPRAANPPPSGGPRAPDRRSGVVSRWFAISRELETHDTSSELNLPDRVLDLADDRVAEVLAAARLVALHRGYDAGHDEGDEQDQGHVLDGALADLGRESPAEPGDRGVRLPPARVRSDGGSCEVHRGASEVGRGGRRRWSRGACDDSRPGCDNSVRGE